MKKPQSLKEWQEMFFSIYGERNERIYSSSDIFLHIVEEVTESVEDLRKENTKGAISNIPDIFAWLLSFCNKMRIDLEKSTWWKYPQICPYCFSARDCICITSNLRYKANRKELQGLRAKKESMPRSLNDWQAMFNRIYGRTNKLIFQVQIWFHLFEEVGEISKSFRFNEKEELGAELADCFSFILAVCTKLEKSLAELSWKIYPGKCRVCKKEKCECPVV